MKPTRINHSLREIRLEYEENDEPLSEFENSAIREYLRLHDVLHDLIRRKDAMAGEVLKFEIQLQACEDDLVLLEKEMIQCGPLAGYTKADIVASGVELREVELSEVIQRGRTHESIMNRWFDDSTPLHANYKKWNADVDVLDDMIDKFKEVYFDEIINNYQDKQIDSCSLDEDIQGFYGIWDSITYQAVFLKNYGAYVKRHNAYLEKVKEAFGRISKISETADELIKSKSNSGFGVN